jgi:DNA-binding FrmR family transcriptional regulator
MKNEATTAEANKASEKKDCCACSEKHKERSPEEYRDLINRLSRIEGQVRGIKAMVERGAYCPDILIQTSAVNSALNSFSKVLLSNHIRTCVRNDIKDGNDEVVEELVATLQKMMK